MNRYYIVVFTLIIFFISCDNKKEVNHLSIDLSYKIGDDKGITHSLNEIVSEYQISPLQTTDSTLITDISDIQIKLVTENDVWLSNNFVIYRFDKKTGKCLSRISRKSGQGPQEYSTISDFVVDSIEKNVLVYDGNRNRIIKYDFNSVFKEAIPNDFIGSFDIMNDSIFVVSYSPLSNHNYHVGLYNEQWNLICNLIPKDAGSLIENSRLFHFDRLIRLGENYGIVIPFNDTIYSINDEKAEPFFIVSKGNLKIPEQIASDISKKKERAEYIFGEYGFFVSPYYFSYYTYQNKIFNDIWDTNKSSLLYRNIKNNIDEEDGLLFTIRDKEIYLIPKFVSNEYLCCVAQPTEMMDIIPSLREDDNPVLLFLKIRS